MKHLAGAICLLVFTLGCTHRVKPTPSPVVDSQAERNLDDPVFTETPPVAQPLRRTVRLVHQPGVVLGREQKTAATPAATAGNTRRPATGGQILRGQTAQPAARSAGTTIH